MDDLTRRFTESKKADDDRHQLIRDLLEKIDDMEKTMDRNAFVLVLIDGDCMNFTDSLIKQGIAGGEEASKRLRTNVWNELRHERGFRLDHKIVIRIFANLRGLSKTYTDAGFLPESNLFADFVLGFNKSHPLCDFIDAGNHKEAADKKIQETLNLYAYNVHCKHIIFGASTDNSYASFLSSFHDADVSSRIRLLKGPPFAPEFRSILSRFKQIEFPDVFRGVKLPPPSRLGNKSSRVQTIGDENDRDAPVLERDLTSSLAAPAVSTASSSFLTRVVSRLKTGTNGESATNSSRDSEQRDELRSHPTTQKASHDLKLEQPFTYAGASSNAGESYHQNVVELRPDIEEALIRATNDQLKETPGSCDFGVIRSRVEKTLSLSSFVWGLSPSDPKHARSKLIIKWAVEDWMERNNRTPPGNATWLHKHFESNLAPTTILQSPNARQWRIKPEPNWCKYASNIPTSGVVASPSKRITGISAGIVGRVHQNNKGQRVDVPPVLKASPALVYALRNRRPRPCHAYCLLGSCTVTECEHDHDSSLDEESIKALTYLARSLKCPRGPACQQATCTKGHICPHPKPCSYGTKCWFADLHNADPEPGGCWLM